jgi:palmitoyltransferase ZDHHC3/7/25
MGCGTHHESTFWLNNEPCGMLCGMITYGLLCYGSYASCFKVILPWLGSGFIGLTHCLLFNVATILAAYSHFAAMTTDPGAVPKDARPLPSDMQEQDPEAQGASFNKYRKFCKRCKAFKPVRAHHCSMCGRCVVKMDHHCPWVNNCVGIGNHKLFLLFLFWVNVVCVYSILLIFDRYMLCFMHSSR